ncbi:unnamed protein product [Rotaria socialis]|uniref:Uncharacterized protein n=3 Tax=Rotaria socialis TaxID=392032 RepID=A0A818WF09_9BILA|nr:unnamed protein product [Rotaria socialis]
MNEINRSDRYKLQNCIFGGVWPGPQKPSREQMLAMSFKRSIRETESFLIGATCDKPAQALVQNTPEPIAKLGCGRCEIPGVTVPSREAINHHIRVFPLSSKADNKAECRSNQNYDPIMTMDSPTEDQRKGYLGKYSLHNLYGGAMKKLLKLWFLEDFKRSNWSCFTKLTILSKTLSHYRYPSTTSRTPRPLVKFHRFKANELRLILLFAAPVFKHYLTSTIYKNYLLLVFALHLAESRSLRSEDIEDIQFLSNPRNTFLYEYPLLYTDHHNQQVMHSIDHVAQSVQNYGQLSNYSTYNFESVLGMLRATVHSTKHHAKEIANTTNLLRLTIRNTLADDFNNELKSTLEQIQNRLWLCDWLKDWTVEDFLHLAPSGEFYVWTARRPNYQNDRIWARSIEDIEKDQRYREMAKNQSCIGIFIVFTCKRLLWVIKDKGESWTDQYFRDIILTQNVFLFLKNEDNVIEPDEHLLQDNYVKFWGNDNWPGNSPDLNVAERIGSIFKDEVEKQMLSETWYNRYHVDTLKMHIENVLTSMKEDTELFETLLCSYPSRLRAVKTANGRHTDY